MIQTFISQYGILAVGVLILLECMGAPLPGETVLLLAGAAAAQGLFPIWAVIGAAAAAAIVGDSLGYWLGKRYGEALLLRVAPWLRLSPHHIQRARTLFQHHGPKAIFFGRWTWLLRTFGALFAGISAVPYRRFLVYNIAGGVSWATTIGLLGYFFGGYLPLIERSLRHFGWLAVVIGGLAVMGMVVLHKVGRRAAHVSTRS